MSDKISHYTLDIEFVDVSTLIETLAFIVIITNFAQKVKHIATLKANAFAPNDANAFAPSVIFLNG